MNKTPLEEWIIKELKLTGDVVEQKRQLEAVQLQRLKETVAYAKAHSPFYQERLAFIRPEALNTFEVFQNLPLTTPAELGRFHPRFLCVSQDEIHRIVTLDTSGTTQGIRKRLFFTQEEQQAILDFFQVGMSTFVQPGDRVLILLPGIAPGSVGDLLQRALESQGIKAFLSPVGQEPEAVLNRIEAEKITCLVGMPLQIRPLALLPDRNKGRTVHSCLMTADYVPRALAEQVERVWNCRVYNHYGMTEMGLGGGVECDVQRGYHLREGALYFEVIDPKTGKPCPPGEEGEVVFTTLTRKGMPLIRYRTGDWSRWLEGACPCGSFLRRLDKIRGRRENRLPLTKGYDLSLGALDELLFSWEDIIDYEATLAFGPKNTRSFPCFQLQLALKTAIPLSPERLEKMGQELSKNPTLGMLMDGATPHDVQITAQIWSPPVGLSKRRIFDKRATRYVI